ncbi:hypothetical protein TorRG33x02_174180 [Trema orientale]|uniref:Uncharacterized protein n=1 Tax=Trema orientale TaxID=63057 RepID=A0A2P5EMN5_TREOI|nr:hypothetical protein TorRG33x02_174180 [Trema orientale]
MFQIAERRNEDLQQALVNIYLLYNFPPLSKNDVDQVLGISSSPDEDLVPERQSKPVNDISLCRPNKMAKAPHLKLKPKLKERGSANSLPFLVWFPAE